MGQLNRDGILDLITTLINDNDTKDITPLDIRTILIPIAVSMFNLLDENPIINGVAFTLKGRKTTNGIIEDLTVNDVKTLLQYLAEDVEYTPAVNLDWNATIPNDVKLGLDQLASRMKLFENIS